MNSTTGKYFRDLWIMYIAIISACLGAAVLSYYLQPEMKGYAGFDHIFTLVGVGMGIIISFGALVVWRQLILNAGNAASFSEKLKGFKMAYLVVLSMMEGACLLNLAFYYIEGLAPNFFMAAAILLVLGSRFPSRSGIINMLRLSNQELIYLNKEDHPLD